MVRNVRWLYSKLGTEDFSVTGQSTVSGALSGLNSELGNKSNTSHTHNTDTLPVSSNQVNSTSYVPTSALLYSMKERADGIQSIIAEAKRELDDPNKRYEVKNLGTWRSASDVDTFLSTYTHENNYTNGSTKLSLGNWFYIEPYIDVQWEIAGFDMEHRQLAADGTVYDNGYGICIIPRIQINSYYWNSSNTVKGGYISSYMHNTAIPNTVSSLKSRLGSHVVNRNVLLSNSVSRSGSTGYTWTTAEGTLMSVGQLTGTFAANNNKYDDGEANYKLPLFNYKTKKTQYAYWLRGTKEFNSPAIWAWLINGNGDIVEERPDNSHGVRPMIYIR